MALRRAFIGCFLQRTGLTFSPNLAENDEPFGCGLLDRGCEVLRTAFLSLTRVPSMAAAQRIAGRVELFRARLPGLAEAGAAR